MKPEIEKSLIMSTGHISKKDGDRLNSIDPSDLIVDNYSFGWRILVTDINLTKLTKTFSHGFIAAILFAKKNNCEWLQLDGDGPEYGFLKTYDW